MPEVLSMSLFLSLSLSLSVSVSLSLSICVSSLCISVGNDMCVQKSLCKSSGSGLSKMFLVASASSSSSRNGLVLVRSWAAMRPFSQNDLLIGKPQMWERAHVGFGGTGRKRKGPCTKQCAWQKHGLCDTRLAEASPPKL